MTTGRVTGKTTSGNRIGDEWVILGGDGEKGGHEALGDIPPKP